MPLTAKEDKNDTIDGENVGIKLNKTQKTIIDVIKENPHCTLEELAEIAMVEKRNVERNIKSLKDNGIIERVGAKKMALGV